MGFILFDLLQDAGVHASTIAGWVNTRRPGQGVDFSADEYRGRTRRAVEAIHPARMRLRLTEVRAETPATKTLRFERLDGELPPFRPGQYIALSVTIDGVRTSRPYTITSIPGQDHLDITVREVPRGFVSTHLLEGVSPGDELESSGPMGSFYHEPLIDGDRLVFLAGGCGVTPFISILRQLEADGWPRRVILLYGSRDPGDVVFADELRRMAEASESFDLVTVMSEPPDGHEGPTGLIDAACIAEHVGEVEGWTFYLCGPQAMYAYCLDELVEAGVPPQRIRQELPGTIPDVTRAPGWPADLTPSTTVRVTVDDTTFEAAATEPLICALERQGIAVPSLCRSGECSACRLRLVSGEIYAPPWARVREADRARRVVHACVSYPITDVELGGRFLRTGC